VATSALGLSHLVSGQRVETSTLTAKIDTSSKRGSELLATPDPATSLAVRAIRPPAIREQVGRQLPPQDVEGFEVLII
jgi:hypothetical protein